MAVVLFNCQIQFSFIIHPFFSESWKLQVWNLTRHKHNKWWFPEFLKFSNESGAEKEKQLSKTAVIWQLAFSAAEFQLSRLQILNPMIYSNRSFTAQKMKFYIKDFFSKCDQIRRFLRIWSHLLKKSLIENFIFCAAF